MEIHEDVRRELVLAHRNRPEPQPSVRTVLDVVTAAVRPRGSDLQH